MFGVYGSLVSAQQPSFEEGGYTMYSGHQYMGRIARRRENDFVSPIAMVRQGAVSTPTVGSHLGARFDHFANEGHQTVSRDVRHSAQTDTAEAAGFMDLYRNRDNRFRLCFPATNTGLFAPNIRLVDLYSSGSSLTTRPYHGPPQFMQPSPGCLITSEP